MAEKKNVMKLARWEVTGKNEKCRAALEERRIQVEDKRAIMEIIATRNRTMTSTMDAHTREWWDMRRVEIIERRGQSVT
jgi:hypothetical protein